MILPIFVIILVMVFGQDQRERGVGDGPPDPNSMYTGGPTEAGTPPPTESTIAGAGNYAQRFSFETTKVTKRVRTLPPRLSFAEDCDYLAYYCMKAYNTGSLCGRAVYYIYYTFQNYCMLDYVNCMERYEVWQVAHMGECVKNFTALVEYHHYPYQDDYFLDQYYIIEDM